MPHINRIRVNNIRYNFGTQFYDDFVMRFDGKNVLYDLANGGGKSVLLLLLLQNLIPNCTLDEKQPVEKLFRGEGASTVIHSLVEWKLDDYLVKDDYRYMLTGFCARKAKAEDDNATGRDAASIEYFNYVIFYRHYNDNDIVNLPLSDGKQRITYPGLKTYLKNLGRQDYNLQVHVFERKGEYQRFISRFGLYESEWEIIRGINRTEGHVRAYFESNYRTTRKVVENLLIEEIIQKAFAARTYAEGSDLSGREDTEMMADTLLQIKDQLTELARRKDEIAHYDSQQEVLKAFSARIGTLDDMYQQEADLEHDMAKTYQTALLNSHVCRRDLAVWQKTQENASARLTELSRKQETVRIQSGKDRLAGMEELRADYNAKIEDLHSQQALCREDLNSRESMNDYLAYLHEQKTCQAAQQAVEHASEDTREVLLQLGKYAAEWQKRCEKQEAEYRSRMLEYRQKIHVNEAMIQESALSEKEKDRALAVIENRIQEAKTTQQELTQEFAELRDAHGLLIIEDADRLLKKNIQTLAEQEKAAAGCQEQIDRDAALLQEKRVRLLQIDPEQQMLNEKIDELVTFTGQYEQACGRMEKLLEIYRADSFENLDKQISERLYRLIFEVESRREDMGRVDRQIAQLQMNNPLAMTPEAEKLMNYIRTCHGITCIFGADYIQSLDTQSRMQLLDRLPMLPYAVILKDSFSELAQDVLLSEKDFGEHVIPVIGLETVVSETEPVDGEHILFAGKGQKLFTDEGAREKQIARLENEKEDLSAQIGRMQDQIDTFHQDQSELGIFMHVYQAKRAQKQKELNQLIEDEKALVSEEEKLKEEILQLEKETEELKTQTQDREAGIAQLRKQAEGLKALVAVNEKLSEVQNQIRNDRNSGKYLSSAVTELADTQLKLRQENAGLAEAADQQEAALKQLAEDRDKWQMYLQPEETEPVDTDIQKMQDDELYAAFCGAREAYEKEHMDLDDKRQLIESCTRSMQRLLKSITDRNQQPEHFEALNTDGRLVPTGEAEIQELRDRLSAISDQLETVTKKLQACEADRNQLYGSVNQAMQGVEQRYGSFSEVDLHNQTYDDYMHSLTAMMDETAGEIAAAERKVQTLTRENYYLEGLKKDLERMLRMYHVAFDLTKETYGADVNLKTRYEELTSRHEYLQRQHYTKREAFEKDKAKTVKSLSLLGADSLAQEISRDMVLPDNTQMAGQLIRAIDETVELIELEKTRVEKNMSELAAVKATFENQCLQICLNIRTELDKLPKMSVITIDGERIQMIGLSVPYIKEAFYSQQMSDYIDQTVAHLDELQSQEDKVRYIRQQLEWKHLFAVIVTDMNAIRLTLYKRERIREQSRYFRYEEAVGSTGQSQGIYIQFLIAIIHYISSINAGAGENEQLRKVIFIDNPFGAAKDIYIWEPIFALLKTNNVQLIVPARGATPAITGMFDVNYVLGQKLMGQGQQTIVVDYHSNIVIQDMEYVKIDYEQQVFDFV